MSRKHHVLKTETEFYQAVELGYKKFEVRQNDRNFRVYDMVCLEEIVNEVPTGRKIENLEIKYVFYGGQFGLDNDYCVFCW